MADKSPRKVNGKKPGKSIKERRADKKLKHDPSMGAKLERNPPLGPRR